jgi:mono/diheme cytochrome c family protein
MTRSSAEIKKRAEKRAMPQRSKSLCIKPRLAAYFLLPTSCFLLLGCHSTPPPTPLSQLTPQQASGHQVFQTHCAQCHYDRETGPLHGPSLLSVFKKPYLPSGAPATDDRVTATILHGRNMMPSQPALNPSINPQDLPDLLSYLHTL